jgi:replicative DNA helicase
VVAFVYREVVYTPCKCSEETKGTTACSCERSKIAKNAEVIVEKQRNGPTGPVKLTFLAEYTSFENQIAGYYAAQWVE